MSGGLADAIGLVGSVLFVAAFGYANWTKAIDKRLFNLLNLLGSALLLISLSVHFNLAAFVLESVWAVIALIGLVAALRSAWKERA